MQVAQARAVAGEWVADPAASASWFRGAFFTGSTAARDLASELPASSDVDVVVAAEGPAAGLRTGKFGHRGVIMDVTAVVWQDLADPGQVAATYYLAPSFAGDHVIADPTGHLARMRAHIAPGFASAAAIRRRWEDVLSRVQARLMTGEPTAPWHEQVSGWLFPTSLTTQVPLVAALRPPTVRMRYLAARQVLAAHGHLDLYRRLLDLTGCAGVRAEDVQHHLDGLAATFDQAAALARTPFASSGDISPAARPVAIDGSQQLIDSGHHREAVFWVIATMARCQAVLAADAPEPVAQAAGARFAAATADLLGVSTAADLRERARSVLLLLPDLRTVARALTVRAAGPSA